MAFIRAHSQQVDNANALAEFALSYCYADVLITVRRIRNSNIKLCISPYSDSNMYRMDCS